MQSISVMIDQLMRTIGVIGYEKTQELLQNAECGGLNFPDSVFEFVVHTVATQFGITMHEIIFGSGRKNDRKMAIGFCVFYLKGIYKYPIDVVATHLNKGLSACLKGQAMVVKLDTRSRHMIDKQYIEYKANFDKVFTPEIKQLHGS